MSVVDYKGREWVVFEERPTRRGFPVLLGKYVGSGRGGKGVIPTKPLIDLLLANAHRVANPDLPISKQAIGVIRKQLKINRYTSILEWWRKHDDELKKSTLTKFSKKHGVSISTASMAERRLGRRRLKGYKK